MHKLYTSLLSLLIVAFLTPTASSKKPRKKKRKGKVEAVQASSIRLELIDTGLLGVPLGSTTADAMKWIEGKLNQSYEPRFAAALDARERDTLRHRLRQEFLELQGKMTKFDGKITGFEASVVQGEFAVGAGESLLLFRDGTVDHYLFFSEGTLWKYARPLRPQDSFATRVAQWTADQGQPVTVEATATTFAGVKWDGLDYAVRLEDRRLVTASDLLVIEWRKAQGAVAKRRASAKAEGAAGASQSELDSYLE